MQVEIGTLVEMDSALPDSGLYQRSNLALTTVIREVSWWHMAARIDDSMVPHSTLWEGWFKGSEFSVTPPVAWCLSLLMLAVRAQLGVTAWTEPQCSASFAGTEAAS